MKTAALALVSCAASVSAFMPAAVSPFAPRILSAAAPAADAPVDQPLETNTILVFEDKNGGDHLALVTDSMSKAKGGRRCVGCCFRSCCCCCCCYYYYRCICY